MDWIHCNKALIQILKSVIITEIGGHNGKSFAFCLVIQAIDTPRH